MSQPEENVTPVPTTETVEDVSNTTQQQQQDAASPSQKPNQKGGKGKAQQPRPEQAPRAAPKQQRTHQNLFVACLPKGLTNPELMSIFEPFGATSCAVMMDVTTGISKGYGFATFPTEEAGKSALDALNHKTVTAGEHTFAITVSPSKHDSKAAIEESRYVYFRNVPACFAEGTIKDVFARYGKIQHHTMRPDPNNKDHLLVMVEYSSVTEAQGAIASCHGTTLFPQVSTIPVMAKFADANVTKALQQSTHHGRRNHGKGPMKQMNGRGGNHNPSGRRMPPSHQQQQGGNNSSQPMAINRTGSSYMSNEGSGSYHQGSSMNQMEGGSHASGYGEWDNSESHHHNQQQYPQHNYHHGNYNNYQGSNQGGHSYQDDGYGGSSYNGGDSYGGGSYPTHGGHSYGGHSQHSYHSTGGSYSSRPRDMPSPNMPVGGQSYPGNDGPQVLGAYPQRRAMSIPSNNGNSMGQSLGNSQDAHHYYEDNGATDESSGAMLNGAPVVQRSMRPGGQDCTSTGSSLNHAGSSATFRHDPYSQNGYSIASDY